jgi:hypothetical protein
MDEFPFAAEFEEQMRRVKAELALSIGDIYEDCGCHPVLCIGISYEEDTVWGVSLIDGSQPRSCSLRHCGVRKLTIEEAWKIKLEGPPDAECRAKIREENRWWVREGKD